MLSPSTKAEDANIKVHSLWFDSFLRLSHTHICWIIFPRVIMRSRNVMFKALWNNIQTNTPSGLCLRRNIIHSLPAFHLHTALCYLHSGGVDHLHARQRHRECDRFSEVMRSCLMQLFLICLQRSRTNASDDGERGLT